MRASLFHGNKLEGALASLACYPFAFIRAIFGLPRQLPMCVYHLGLSLSIRAQHISHGTTNITQHCGVLERFYTVSSTPVWVMPTITLFQEDASRVKYSRTRHWRKPPVKTRLLCCLMVCRVCAKRARKSEGRKNTHTHTHIIWGVRVCQNFFGIYIGDAHITAVARQRLRAPLERGSSARNY